MDFQEVKPTVLLVDTLSASNDYAVELAEALAPRSNLTVFTVEESPLIGSNVMQVIPRFPRYGKHGSRVMKSLKALRGTLYLIKALWTFREEIIHVQFHRFPRLELPIYIILRPFLSCLVITVHNFLPHERSQWQWFWYRTWYRLGNRLHALSAHIANDLIQRMGIPSAHISVIQHGNYARFFNRNRGHRDLGGLREPRLLDNDVTVITFFGLIRAYKGVSNLTAAFAHIREGNAILVIAGRIEKSAEVELADSVGSLPNRNRCIVIGRYLSEPELAALLVRSDLVVFPYHEISQSGALMLAMTFGKTVIATDIPGFREYIKDGDTGVLCDTSNPGKFGDVLQELTSDRVKRERLGANARQEMETKYSWSRIADELIRFYAIAREQKVIGKK